MKSKYDWSKEIHGDELNERQILFIFGVITIIGLVSMFNQ